MSCIANAARRGEAGTDEDCDIGSIERWPAEKKRIHLSVLSKYDRFGNLAGQPPNTGSEFNPKVRPESRLIATFSRFASGFRFHVPAFYRPSRS
jgi:hypothetical protein